MKKVAVITRTKDRQILLRRALKSVDQQGFRDFSWVIVNDAGEKKPVDEVAALAKQSGIDVHVIHRSESKGMEAATNAGIHASNSEYLSIHDDDDSWHPDFLNRMVAFLDADSLFAGVVCHSEEVTEEIKGNKVVEKSRKPMNAEIHDIHISELFYRNLFPPISLLYRREVLCQTGLYDEALPVLGDWDFNLRLILHGDIAVLEERLAFYHVRKSLNHAPNSIHSKPHLHKRYEAVIRNRLIRSGIRDSSLHPSVIMALASFGRSKRGVSITTNKEKPWIFL